MAMYSTMAPAPATANAVSTIRGGAAGGASRTARASTTTATA
jgi:hypothetical protein